MHPDPIPPLPPNEPSPAFDEDAWFSNPPRPSLPRDNSPPEPWQFSIRELMVYTAAFAAALGLLRALGIVGLAIIVGFSLALTIGMSFRPSNRGRTTLNAILWGIVLPLFCVVCDPMIFHESPAALMSRGSIPYGLLGVLMEGELPQPSPLGRWAYPLILTQFAALATWLIGRHWLGRCSAFWSGMLSVGAAFAGVVGILMLVPAIVLLAFFGLGIVGFVPGATAWVYLDQAVAAWREANRLDHWPREEYPDAAMDSEMPYRWTLLRRTLYFLGVAAALMPPLLFAIYGPR